MPLPRVDRRIELPLPPARRRGGAREIDDAQAEKVVPRPAMRSADGEGGAAPVFGRAMQAEEVAPRPGTRSAGLQARNARRRWASAGRR
jgi:hypothetical protein